MSWIGSIGVSLLSGVAGLLLAGLIANACVSWYHVTSREGAAGYFVLFAAIGGGVAGLFVGLVTARIVSISSGPGFGRELLAAFAVVIAIAGLAALLCRFLADVPPQIDGRPLDVEVEFRFPVHAHAAMAPTAEGEWKFWLGSIAGNNQRHAEEGTILTNAARLQEGRWIVPAEVFLFTERGKRTITLQNGNQDPFGFFLPLPPRPGRNFEQWSDWLPRQTADGLPWPSDRMSYRFRVQKQAPPPPPRSYEEIQAESAAKEEADFASIPADAPIERWFPYIYKNPQKDRAFEKITKRPTFLSEFATLAIDGDAESAATTLRLVENHPHPTATLIPPVQAAGRDIAERIRKFNATSVEADPSYLGAADISIRFNGWMAAVRTLRSSSAGDFTPELKTILELSRVRKDSHVMQVDVCRVASFYLHEWTGTEPLPTDPKPR